MCPVGIWRHGQRELALSPSHSQGLPLERDDPLRAEFGWVSSIIHPRVPLQKLQHLHLQMPVGMSGTLARWGEGCWYNSFPA